MLALTPTPPPPPPFISTNIVGWPLEDPIRHEDQNYFFRDIATSSDPDQYSLLFLNNYFPAPPPPSDHDHHHHRFEVDRSTTPSSSTTITINTTTDLTMVKKKLNHNASERDRRKKVNHMYSALRALLPISDHTKKLSIPATVSRVLKYVPELQEEIEGLVHMKKELLSRIKSRQQGNTTTDQEINKIKSTAPNSLSSISATQLSGKEVAVQISTYKLHNNLLSQMLHNLENDGLSLLHASSFESFGGRLFHNLHLQVEGSYCMESGTTLDKKLLSFHDNKEKLLIM